MADDKKNIPGAGKMDVPSKPGKTEAVKAPPVQDPPVLAKAKAHVIKQTKIPQRKTSAVFGRSGGT